MGFGGVEAGILLIKEFRHSSVENQKIMIIRMTVYQSVMNPFNMDNLLFRPEKSTN